MTGAGGAEPSEGADPAGAARRGESTDSSGAAAAPEGPWVRCPRCLGVVSLARFFPGDEEPDTAFAVCPACATHVTLLSPPEPPREPR